jgi:hypothetical protein
MKYFLLGKAQNKPQAIGLLTEDLLLNPSAANEQLKLYNLKIDHIETVNGEKVVYIKENEESKLLCE